MQVENTNVQTEIDTSVKDGEIIRTDDDRYGDVVISAYNLQKYFKIFFDKGNQLKEKLLFRKRSRYEIHEVLKGINFEIRKGEAWGLIGQNGCGKSTTLKLLTRIMYPDGGEVHVNGRVSSMLELGAGFHPDMSGRENIYTNASIFGLSKKDIDERLDDIIAFSELGKYIDNPVRTYSSGMYLRLAFSVAINVNAEILFIDEILAVGDANFQAKCFNRLREIKAQGTTIVIVSHNLGQIEQICNKTLWLEDGKVREAGPPRIVHPKYLAYMGQKRQESIEREKAEKKKKEEAARAKAQAKGKEPPKKKEEPKAVPDDKRKWEGYKNRWGTREIEMTKIRVTNKDGVEQSVFRQGDDMKIIVDYQVNSPCENVDMGFGIFRVDGLNIYGTNTRLERVPEFNITKSGQAVIDLYDLQLLPGQYIIYLALEGDMSKSIDFYRDVTTFEMYSVTGDIGTVRIKHNFNIGTAEYVDQKASAGTQKKDDAAGPEQAENAGDEDIGQ
ncbi:MAG: ABC transporter ATP-binding protein [Lachnospiraceae bacterium]|nr:ABC transporter ATP-binding protein [Lachnospiraceae bacterium]